MTVFNDTMQQYAMKYEQVQQKLVNTFTKPAPFMQTVPFVEATHGLENKFERVTKIEGAEFKEIDAPYKEMDVETVLASESLGIMGGRMVVPQDRALLIARTDTSDPKQAAAQVFARRTDIILNDAGKKTEQHLIYNHLYKKALAWNATVPKNERTVFSKGGSGNANYSILAIRQEKGLNCGLVSPVGKNKNEIMTMEWLNGGAAHEIASGKDKGKVGYEAIWKAYFGYQVAIPQYVGAIFNIDPSSDGTMVDVNDIAKLLSSIEADPSDTVLVMSRFLSDIIYGMKWDKVTLGNGDKNLEIGFDKFNGIKIIATNNMLRGTESNVTVPA